MLAPSPLPLAGEVAPQARVRGSEARSDGTCATPRRVAPITLTPALSRKRERGNISVTAVAMTPEHAR